MVKQRYSVSDLPYAYDALEPVISKEVMELHHDKHHLGYVKGTNAAISLLESSRGGDTEVDLKGVLKNLSFNLNGHLLHELYWTNMRPSRKNNEPSAVLSKILDEAFGCIDDFREEFMTAALSVEGSGWGVLLKNIDNDFIVMQVEKHNMLHIAGYEAVLVVDVWEHAYYLDYKNDRSAYLDAWWDVVNWDDVEKRVIGR